MTASQSNLAGLSRFVFRAPTWYRSLGFAVVLAGITGIGAFEAGDAQQVWRGVLFLGRDAWEGIFFIGVPTAVAAVVTAWVDEAVGGRLSPDRSSLLAVAGELIVVGVLAVAAATTLVTPLGQTFVFDALVVALATVFALRLLVVMAVSRHSLLLAAVPASIHPLAAALLLFVYSGTLRLVEFGGRLPDVYLELFQSRAAEAPAELSAISPTHFGILGASCVVYAAATWVFLYVFDRPWRQSMGVSVLDFVQGFIGHLAEGSRELEDFFEQLGEEAVVPVTVLSFRTADGEKARWSLPMIHPGPMGEIGGGNLPLRVAESAEGLAFPPHATAGHDFNLVTEREVDRLIDAARDAADRIEYGTRASRPLRVQSGEASVLGQSFGDDTLLVSTFAPGFADDVEYAVGLSAAAEARAGGAGDVLLADAHNSNDGLEGADLGHVTPGSQRSFDLIGAAGTAAEQLVGADEGSLRVGVAWERTEWEPRDGIGPLGVRVMVTEVGDERAAYVLVDGNNMEPGLRGEILDRLDVASAEVLTTDTHIVNTVEAENQVGSSIEWEPLIDTIDRLVGEAVADLEPVEAGMATEHAEVTVFGNDQTETLASHANAAVQMGGALAAS
ncbi:MAG: DUF2070 family protein, partial [Halobaculum sp.]